MCIRDSSVTLPYKQKILRHLHDCDSLARAIGAVNTVVVRGAGKLYGYNTDYIGVLRALQLRISLPASRVLIVGAGGAARAVAFALAQSGACLLYTSHSCIGYFQSASRRTRCRRFESPR